MFYILYRSNVYDEKGSHQNLDIVTANVLKKMFEMSAAEALLSLSESFPHAQPENLAQNDVENNTYGPDSHSFTTAINQCPGSDKIEVVLSESSLDEEKIVKIHVGKADMVRHSIWLHTLSKKCHFP